MVFADQAPNQRCVLDGTLVRTGSPDPVSRLLRQTAPCPLPLQCHGYLDRQFQSVQHVVRDENFISKVGYESPQFRDSRIAIDTFEVDHVIDQDRVGI
jgi:hypothetical protein